ncbi:MAG: hypothetical protein ACWA40_11240 [Planktomarina sp.]
MRNLLLILGFLALSACGAAQNMSGGQAELGNYRMGLIHMQVHEEVQKGPFSRDVSDQEWKTALQPAFDQHFAKFEGDRTYHIGIKVLGYVVAKPGIPLVASPKSILIFDVVVVDDEKRIALNVPRHELTVIEKLSGSNMLGSGFSKTKEEQLAELAEIAAKATEDWMREQPWFYTDDPMPIKTATDS